MYRASRITKILSVKLWKLKMSFLLGELTNSPPPRLVAQHQVRVADLCTFIFDFVLRCKTYIHTQEEKIIKKKKNCPISAPSSAVFLFFYVFIYFILFLLLLC